MYIKNIVPIVLTATIRPRATLTTHLDPDDRRLEYLRATKYYSKFAKVFLLENSGYDFKNDLDFSSLHNVTYLELKPSNEFDKGKGYQEFEMLDSWFKIYGKKYQGFVKITGRYLIKNIESIMTDAYNSDPSLCIFERKKNALNIALTDLFYSGSAFYEKYLIGCYLNANDSEGHFIEHEVGKVLMTDQSVRVFSKCPIKSGISGSNGGRLSSYSRIRIVSSLRNFLFLIEKKHRLL